jgi:NitT/TauT family transport system substrate-binding protein
MSASARPREPGVPAFSARRWISAFAGISGAAIAVSILLVAPAMAEEVRIGIGFGLAFLPTYICEDAKLVEKYGKEAHLDLKVSYQRYLGAGALQEAIGAGAIDVGPFGTAPLLVAWDKAKESPRQILGVSGITTLPLVLLTNRANVHTLADFRSTDRIAVPAATAPQRYLLQMQAEKVFGQYDRLRKQVVVMSHPDAAAALLAETAGPVGGYFSSAPYSGIVLADDRIHKVLSSADVIDGKASFLIMGATKSYVAAHPGAAEAVAKAMDEAARTIRDDPHHAAEIYLVHEPSKTLDVAALTAVIDGIKDEFGSAVHGVQAFADFMSRHGELKTPPQSWKEIVAPALLKSPST